MAQFQSGIFEKTRLVSNILMLLLVAGNIFFSIQYTQGIIADGKRVDEAVAADKARTENTKILRSFINTVINTTGSVSLEDRIKLENDIRQSHDSAVIALWDAFAAAKDGKSAQTAAVALMVLLVNKTI